MLLLAATLVAAQPAPAAQKCWEKVIDDWYQDGRIDGTYQRRCYTEALRNIPNDVKDYGSFEEDVKTALQRATRNDRSLQVSPGSAQEDRRGRADEPRDGLFQAAFEKTSPRNADSMPLPLLILGGLALLLIAAGAAGLISRRLRARRASTP